MRNSIRYVIAIAATGILAACAQTPAMDHAMMMSHMPMMKGHGGSSPDMEKMMAACMEHMQATSAPRDGARPLPPPAR